MSPMPLDTYWDGRYRTDCTAWHVSRPSPELVQAIAEARIAPCAAIDLGCGLGNHAIWLAQQGFDVTAVDVSPLAIERARADAETAGVHVRFVTADLLELPDLGGPCEFFFDRGCYHFVRGVDAGRYVQCLEALTRPGSVGLILAGNARERRRRPLVRSGGITISQTGPPGVHEEQLRSELGALFEITWLREFRFESDTDAQGWLGWSCLVRRP